MPEVKTQDVNASSTQQPRKIARSLTGFTDSFMGSLSSVGRAPELKREKVVEGGGSKMEGRREAITQGLGNFAKSLDSFVGSMWLGANESLAEAASRTGEGADSFLRAVDNEVSTTMGGKTAEDGVVTTVGHQKEANEEGAANDEAAPFYYTPLSSPYPSSHDAHRCTEPERGGGGAERGSLKSASLRSSTKSTPARTPRAVEETPRSELVAQLHQLVSRLPVGQDRPLTRQLQ